MTPQERALVQELFDRLAALENAPRDRDAERLINEGLQRAPNAVYALVQTVLVQDEALKVANARIAELEAELDQHAEPQKGFLDSMRDSVFGSRDDRRGSVPSVPAGAPGRDPSGMSTAWRTGGAPAGAPMGGPGGYPGGSMPGGYGGGYAGAPPPQEGGRGGSFLGTAAAAAAGMIGGSLLLGSIRSALGGSQQQHGPFSGAFDQLSGQGQGGDRTPSGGGGDLSKQAGLDDIGGGRSAGLAGSGRSDDNPGSAQRDESEREADADYDDGSDLDDDGNYDDGDDGDFDSGGDDLSDA